MEPVKKKRLGFSLGFGKASAKSTEAFARFAYLNFPRSIDEVQGQGMYARDTVRRLEGARFPCGRVVRSC